MLQLLLANNMVQSKTLRDFLKLVRYLQSVRHRLLKQVHVGTIAIRKSTTLGRAILGDVALQSLRNTSENRESWRSGIAAHSQHH